MYNKCGCTSKRLETICKYCEFDNESIPSPFFLEGLMADKKDLPIEEEEDERNLNYKPPVQKSLQEIQELDRDDQSLVKYKQTLLGPVPVTAGVCGFIVYIR